MRTLEEIKKAADAIDDRKRTMRVDKQVELDALNEERDERETERADIRQRMQTAETPKEYAALKAKDTDLSMEIEYFDNRISERENRPFVTETESDSVIDELLQMEKDAEAAFAETVLTSLDELKEQYDKYGELWRYIEQILKDWQRQIYPNYRGFGTIFTVDGKKTERSPKPRPIRYTPYNGGKIYETAEQFMRTAERLREEKKND